MLATRQVSDARQPGRPFPAIELASLHAVKQVLLGSDAIARLTLPCVADELERGTLVVLPSGAVGVHAIRTRALEGAQAKRCSERLADCLRRGGSARP